MILYKYLSLVAGAAVIETATLGFSRAETFNDPFDKPSYPRPSGGEGAGGFFDGFRLFAKNHSWAQNTGILSLTRTPSNPLMWAHYADKHRGMVIGIDMAAAGLSDEKTNLIPAQFGSIIYVSSQPTHDFLSKPPTGIAVGETHEFPIEHYEKLQRLFLHKPLDWAYEEEVRVLKCVNGITATSESNDSGSFQLIRNGGDTLFCYATPPSAFVEVYFGLRADGDHVDTIAERARRLNERVSLYDTVLSTDRYKVGAEPYVSGADAAREG